MTYIILSLVAGGVARAFVGTGLGPKWLGRWSVYPPVAAAILLSSPALDLTTYANFGLFFWAVLVSSLNLGLGGTNWESWKHQVLRFGLPSIALILPLLFQNPSPLLLLYPLCVASIAACYPMRQRAFELLRFRERTFNTPFGSVDWDSARLAELALGAAVLGGLAIL